MNVSCTASKFCLDGKGNPFIRRRIAGIYAIRNLKNRKVYVGSAVSIYDRLYNHIWHLERGTHHNPLLLNAWRKHTLSAFSLEVLEIVEMLHSLLEREQFWIEKLEALTAGYNLSPNAGSNLGRVFGQHMRKAVARGASKAMADPIVKMRHRQATIAAMRDPEVKRKCGDRLKKRWQDPAARSLLTASRWGTGTVAYRVTSPDGQIYSISNLKQFCLEHTFFSYWHAMSFLCGRSKHLKGYLLERING